MTERNIYTHADNPVVRDGVGAKAPPPGGAAQFAIPRHTRPDATAFSLFATLYMTSFLLDITEKWQHPGQAFLALVVIPFIALRGVTKWTFLAFLALSSLHYLTTAFPDVANHNNLFLLCNLLLVASIVYSSMGQRRASGLDASFEVVKPSLRVMLALVYFFTGFHKLNSDFFHPMAGCASTFSHSMLQLVLSPMSPVRVTSAVQNVVLPDLFIIAMGLFVLVWELGAGLALWSRRLQLPALLLCLTMHLMLAQLAFFDFSSLALALFLVFVPNTYWSLLAESPVRVGSIRLRRDLAYLLINAMSAIAAGILFWRFGPWEPIHRLQGAAFTLASVVYLRPWLVQLVPQRRTARWDGVPMWSPLVPKWLVVFPLFLVFFAINPYLGLRTAGTFTMFSNLRTEGDRSNHWLLGSNPLKLWNYQENVVDVIDIDPRHQRRFRLEGYLLPVVEFKKGIYEWKQKGVEGLRATYVYKGDLYKTDDVVRDNPWNVRARDLEMLLLDFRVVQKSPTPNRCRW